MNGTMVELVETRKEIDPEQAAEAEMARRRRGGHWLMAAAWVLSSTLALGAEAPAPGQTVAEWQNAVTADLEARGRKMGFALEPCALKPPFAGAPQTYLSRAFSQAMTPAPIIPQPDSMITEVAAACGAGRTRVNGVCVARTTLRQTQRAIRRCATGMTC